MGEAVEPPAVTRFGQSNKDDLARTIDLAAQDDLPAAPDLNTEDDWTYPYPTDFVIQEKSIDENRPLKVAVIGAGIAGITAGVLLPIKVPGIQVIIFDKNSDVGGTWVENIYPGVRCDIPSHCYQSTYSPKVNWSEEYAQGHEIKEYWQSLARKYDVHSKCRFRTKVDSAQWDEGKAKWVLDILNIAASTTESMEFDFIITANGHFNEWKMPDYPGIETFKGHIRHSSNWDPSFDPRGKRIATIGNGASGIQVTTALQKQAAHVDHYARNKTWIAGSFNPSTRERQETAMPFSEEQLRDFQDPEKYLAFRKQLEGTFFRRFESILRDSETTRQGTERFKQIMRERLGEDAELLEKMVPSFPPFCRRLTPGPGYLEAITKDNLTFIQDPIDHFTEDGIVTKDGVHRPVDAVICSTGANVDFAPPFPIVSGEHDLSRDWKPDGKFGFPYTYLGLFTPHFPNLAYLLGPNPPGTSGTVPHGAEIQTTYIAKLLRKISSQGIKTVVPSKRAADDFLAYCDGFFPRTNMSRKCSSWYNGGRPGARIHGVWPGSGPHLTRVLREPKWEDFEYTYENGGNRFGFLGNGWTDKERDLESDLTPWLRLESQNDLKDLHERWWDL